MLIKFMLNFDIINKTIPASKSSVLLKESANVKEKN